MKHVVIIKNAKGEIVHTSVHERGFANAEAFAAVKTGGFDEADRANEPDARVSPHSYEIHEAEVH